MNQFVRSAWVAGLLGAFVVMRAQAPAGLGQQGWYADPEVHIFGGQYWVYPTYSGESALPGAAPLFTADQQARRARPGVPSQYKEQTFLDAFSSPDLVHWTRHAHVLDVKDVGWAAYAVWAPTVMAANGKYYLIFGANDIQKDQTAPGDLGGIGLAVSDRPEGPFVDVLGKPLIGRFEKGAQPIDPFVFRDDDGSIYLYYGGQGHCNVARLSADLKAVIPLQGDKPDSTMFKEITPERYVEGPFVVKRHGVYYFMWSEGGWGGPDYSVAYAKSSSPTGPFTRVGKILETNPAIATGPGHHSVLHIPGTDEWYIVYHRHPLGSVGPNQRIMAIDRMVFDTNGDIVPVKMTKDGVAARVLQSGVADR